jgi:hypothetical protein
MTSDTTTLDIGLDGQTRESAPARLPARWIAIGCIVLAALAAIAQLASGPALERLAEATGWSRAAVAPAPVKVTASDRQAVAALTVDDEKQIVVAGKLAEERNAAIPVSALPLEKVRGFLLAGAQRDVPSTALTCLTQAVYYEAGFEPVTGKRAVAQVVLNRMRHPAYPSSVCGVVYQGWERRTGCQFSFTCDGSLLRPPGAAAWQAAMAVAKSALAGYVEPSVGTATHYHADYVLPKWAFQLAKIQQIGAHIFYRFRGGWGTAGAFDGAYSGHERIPALNYDALRERGGGALVQLADPPLTPGATVPRVLRPDPRDRGERVNVTKLWQLDITDGKPGRGHDTAGVEPQDIEEDKPLPVSNSAASALPEH